MPILLNKKWYSGKTPTLQIKILRYIAITGSCSRRIVERALNSHYADVHNAFDILENKKLIKKSGELDNLAKSKPSLFYKVTEKGLESFLDIDPCEPIDFWSALLWYYVLKKDPIKNKKVIVKNPTFVNFCNNYYSKYLGKKLEDIYFQSDLFFLNELYKRHYDKTLKPIHLSKDDISEYTEAVKSITKGKLISDQDFDNDPALLFRFFNTIRFFKNNISNERKILENLALNRYATINDLSNYTGIDIDQINNVINKYTIESYVPHNFTNNDSRDKNKMIQEYLNFLDHNLIIKSHKSQEPKYSLSLFGIMIIFKLWWNDANFIDDHIVFTSLYEKTFKKFISITARNYKEKLPFIFDKLDIVARIGQIQIYEIFLSVFYSAKRKASYSKPLSFGGNKEIYDMINNLSLERAIKLYKLYNGCDKVLSSRLNYNDTNKQTQYRKLEKFYKKIMKHEIRKISALLKYVNIKIFFQDINKNYDYKYNVFNISLKNELNVIESLLSREITFLILINWIDKFYAWEPFPFLWFNERIKSIVREDVSLDTIKEIDKDINEQFLIWFKDALDYNNKTTDILNNLNKKMTSVNS